MSRRQRWALAGAVMAPAVVFLLLDALFPFPLERLQKPPSAAVFAADGEPLRFFLAADDRWRFPVALADLPPEVPAALVASEDRWFYYHPGVNPVAIVRAAWQNLTRGRVVSGASTLPMQLARLADPAPRTLGVKLREAFRATQLVFHHDRHGLLELYLSHAPFGGNLEGIAAASWFYFGKSPARLSAGEIALLVALPRSPRRYDPTLQPAAAREVRGRVLDELVARGVFRPEQAAAGKLQPLPPRRRAVPFAAPHFALWASQLYPGRSRVDTTLDRRLQHLAEERVRRRLPELRARGLGNTAVVVVELETRAIRALVGSADFFEAPFQGQVNGALARRSPGSALKPLLYGMAFDEGLLAPESYVLDVPAVFADGYQPENFDGQYHGRVTAREALIRSFNPPAVELLVALGFEPFLQRLRRGGLSTLDRPAEDYGAALVLGAGEVRLVDLTNLYATLADGGRHRPFQVQENPAAAPSDEPLLSPEAAWQVAEILRGLQRPDLPRAWDLTVDVPAVAWKTGTSFGHRDAWALGFSRRYAIGVWVGSFSGVAHPGISGSEHAGPLLFDLFRALDPGAGLPPRPAGLRLTPRELCALSHELPGPHCPRRETFEVATTLRLGECSLHRRALVDAATGELLTGDDCLRTRPHEWRLLTRYPPALVAWWRATGQGEPPLPAVSPACRGGAEGLAPQIVSPAPGATYHLRREAPREDQRIALLARADPAVRQLWWYQDGRLVVRVPAGDAAFLDPTPGRHRLVVTDDLGRSTGLDFRVE